MRFLDSLSQNVHSKKHGIVTTRQNRSLLLKIGRHLLTNYSGSSQDLQFDRGFEKKTQKIPL